MLLQVNFGSTRSNLIWFVMVGLFSQVVFFCCLRGGAAACRAAVRCGPAIHSLPVTKNNLRSRDLSPIIILIVTDYAILNGGCMREKTDLKTLELPGVKRPPGRPPKPDAMTAAERQAARRARLRASGIAQLSVDVPIDVLDALSKFVEFKDLTKGEVVARVMRDRLLRKR